MTHSEIFFLSAMGEWIRGPLAWAAFLICGAGIFIQYRRLLAMTRTQEPLQVIPLDEVQTRGSFADRLTGWLIFLRISILGHTPFMAGVSLIFHSGLMITPLFVLAHNELLDMAFGISFVSFSEAMTTKMTLLVVACGAFFFLRRIFVRRVRAITAPSDFVLLLIAVGPFLTGWLAHSHVLNYQLMIMLHILSAEIMLIMIPFSKFSHMIFFFVSRWLIAGEHGRITARRVWRYERLSNTWSAVVFY